MQNNLDISVPADYNKFKLQRRLPPGGRLLFYEGDFLRPVIGLIPLWDDEKGSYWMLPGYMKVIEACGGLPIMLPLTAEVEELEQCLGFVDGLLFTGGHDVGPDVYRAEASPLCGTPCRPRDEMEAWLLRRAIELNKPVFGICRGIQFINAALGGTLYQDLPTEHPSDTEHHMTPPYDRGIHSVTVLPHTRLARIIGAGRHMVNSYHHQAVKALAPGLEPMAVSEDGLIEALQLPGQRFCVGVQWHPEFSYESNPESLALVQAFVHSCQ